MRRSGSGRLGSIAIDLRKTPTWSESRLWRWLRNRRFAGFKFRRQHPVSRFVLDFYCPQLMLAIEIDGSQHENPWIAELDEKRTRTLEKLGIQVVRIPNRTLITDPLLTCDIIQWAIDLRLKELANESR